MAPIGLINRLVPGIWNCATGSPGSAEPGGDSGPAPAKCIAYKSIEIIAGEPVIRYSTERPASGLYETLEP